MAPIANQACKQCGQPAVEGRVDLDGSVTYLCAQHVATKPPPPKSSEADAAAAKDDRKA